MSVDQYVYSVQKMYVKIILEVTCNVSLFSCWKIYNEQSSYY